MTHRGNGRERRGSRDRQTQREREKEEDWPLLGLLITACISFPFEGGAAIVSCADPRAYLRTPRCNLYTRTENQTCDLLLPLLLSLSLSLSLLLFSLSLSHPLSFCFRVAPVECRKRHVAANCFSFFFSEERRAAGALCPLCVENAHALKRVIPWEKRKPLAK